MAMIPNAAEIDQALLARELQLARGPVVHHGSRVPFDQRGPGVMTTSRSGSSGPRIVDLDTTRFSMGVCAQPLHRRSPSIAAA